MKKVEKVAKQTLDKLKIREIKHPELVRKSAVERQVRSIIYENLFWLHSEVYTDEDVNLKSIAVYQYVSAGMEIRFMLNEITIQNKH